MLMIMNEDQIIDQFYNIYNNDLHFIPAKKEAVQDRIGKVKYNYAVKKQPITKGDFIEHLTTGSRVVTIGQLNQKNECKWGAIDIDEYESSFVDSVKQKIYDNKYPLNIVQSVSGGLHLYLYSEEPISGELMRNGLAYFRDQLKLNSKIEIVTFPIISSNTLFVVAQVGAWEYTFDIKNKTIQTFHTKYKNTGKKKCNID